MKGKVKFFNRTKGFGFIAGEDNKEYFVHESGIKKGPIDENDDVIFDVEEGDRGPKAVKVEKADKDSETADVEEADKEPETADVEEAE